MARITVEDCITRIPNHFNLTLAAAYREKFGRPLVICVDNVVDRKHLLSSGWRRVEHSPAREARFALGEVIDIADLRFDQLVADANPMRAAWDAGVERL